MKLVYQCVVIFFNFSTTSNHLHPLQVENCGSNSRIKMTMVNSGLKKLNERKTGADNLAGEVLTISDQGMNYDIRI